MSSHYDRPNYNKRTYSNYKGHPHPNADCDYDDYIESPPHHEDHDKHHDHRHDNRHHHHHHHHHYHRDNRRHENDYHHHNNRHQQYQRDNRRHHPYERPHKRRREDEDRNRRPPTTTFPNGKEQPHLQQNPNPVIREKPLAKEERFLDRNAPRKLYYERDAHEKSVVHWGQRKLLMSEIEFLTDYGEKGDIVLYAGAAPGTHTKFLSDLFPDIKFVLVDPADFICPSIEGKIEVRQEYFTDDIAKEYSDEKYHGRILFISDIRRNAKDDNMIQEDMDMQSRWHKMIKPKKTMLKFRLTWKKGITKYLDGKIYLPVWGPQSTTESRLVPDGDNEREYDNTEYEEQMFYFNTVTRATYYPHDIDGEGHDNCFDCASEILIIQEYLKKKKMDQIMVAEEGESKLDESRLKELTEEMAHSVTKECSIKGRNLLTGPKKVEKNFPKFNHVTMDKLVKSDSNML